MVDTGGLALSQKKCPVRDFVQQHNFRAHDRGRGAILGHVMAHAIGKRKVWTDSQRVNIGLK